MKLLMKVKCLMVCNIIMGLTFYTLSNSYPENEARPSQRDLFRKTVLIYNRVPKTGSDTVRTLMLQIGNKDLGEKFHFWFRDLNKTERRDWCRETLDESEQVNRALKARIWTLKDRNSRQKT